MAEQLLVQVTGGRLLVSITAETENKWFVSSQKFSKIKHAHAKTFKRLGKTTIVAT